MRDIDEISGGVLDMALRLYGDLGSGLLESVYEMVLAGKLAAAGYDVARQRPVDVEFEGLRFEAAFRIGLVVDHRLLVEIKSVEHRSAAYTKQLLTYLRLTRQPVGLLIKFGGATLKEGARRILKIITPPRLRVNQIDRRE